MAFTPFSPRQPAASARLPLTLISLDDWALAPLTGAAGRQQGAAEPTRRHYHARLPIASCAHAQPDPSSVPPR